MSATETKTENAVELISDDSRVKDGMKGAVTQWVKGIVDSITEAISLGDKLDNVYGLVAANRCKIRAAVLLADNEPDWAGTSQTYKHLVNKAERAVLDNFSEAQVQRFQNNVRSHVKRTALAPVILDYVRSERAGMKDLPDNSPKLASEMRRQYDRAKLAIPEQWRETAGPSGGPDPSDPKNATASAINAASVALGKDEMSAVEAIGHVHHMLTPIVVNATALNAEVRGGKKLASDALRNLAIFANAGSEILGNANLTAERREELAAAIAKYAYNG